MHYIDRYLRQQKLLGSKEHKLHELVVGIVGVGGIGAFSALLCAQLGVKKLILVDRDKARSTDLGRQALYTESDVGKAKVEAAREKLQRINPNVEVGAWFEQLEERNARKLLEDADIILDGTDNYETRKILNRYCANAGKPCIFISALKMEGWVFSFIPGMACFECWAPKPQREIGCEEVGVLNTAVALAASLQVQELVSWASGKKAKLGNKILRFNLENASFEKIKIEKRKVCPACGTTRPDRRP